MPAIKKPAMPARAQVQDNPMRWGYGQSTQAVNPHNGIIDDPRTGSDFHVSPSPATPALDTGGAIPDTGDTGDTDNQTGDIDSALNTVDQIMQFGYQQHGLTGGSDTGDGSTQVADNQNAPRPIQPKPGTVPQVPRPTPFNPRDFLPGGSQSTGYDAGGQVQQPQPISGALPTVEDEHAAAMNQVFTQGAKAAVANTRKASSGSRSYADGGAIEDEGAIPDPTQQAQPQAQQAAPGSGGGGQPQNMSRIVGLVQGQGAMPPQQAQQLEKQSGETDPNVAKIKTAAALAQQGGSPAAWSYLQSLRKQFDTARTAAAVKASMGALPQSTQAANIAMTNVLDGTDTKFTPDPGGQGVTMTVNKLNRGSPAKSKRYDDGGAINTDDTDVPDSSVTPSQSPEAAVGNSAIGSYKLTLPQYYQILMGKEGQFDQLYNSGPAAAATSVAKGPGMQPQQTPQQQNTDQASQYVQSTTGGAGIDPSAAPAPGGGLRKLGAMALNAGKNLLNPGAAGMAPEQDDTPNTDSTTDTNPPPQQGGAPGATPATPPPQAQGGTPAAQPQTAGQSGPAETDHEAMERIYGKDAVRAAELAHPMVSQGADRMAQLQGERGEQLKSQAQIANTRVLTEGRQQVAGIQAGKMMNVAQIRAAASNQNSANRLFGVLEGIASTRGNNALTNAVRAIGAKAAAGQAMTDQDTALIQHVQSLANNVQSQAPQQAAPLKDNTKSPGVGGQTMIKQAKNGLYYKTNADGIVIDPTPVSQGGQ